MEPIIQHFTDNDLYKFTTMHAVQKLYPFAGVKYKFFNRNAVPFPEGFDQALREQINYMQNLQLTEAEAEFLRTRCYYFDPVFIDLLKGYRYNPAEVQVSLNNGQLDVSIEGYWYRTVLWEVPLMAIISELYFKMTNQAAQYAEEKAIEKARCFREMKANYSEFGTRRRYSFEVHDKVFARLMEHSGNYLKGTSNVYMAMKYNTTPIGTHPHEWFMFHASQFGYRMANAKSLEAWTDVYHGNLGIALTDTFTTDNFFSTCSVKYAKLFDGLRWDSGDPIVFTNKVIDFYHQNRIDPKSKTVVYSDALDLDRVEQIRKHVNGRMNDAYGIGTYLTNDVGVKPLNMVIKLTQARWNDRTKYVPTVKLSDVEGKHTGDAAEIELCKKSLGIA